MKLVVGLGNPGRRYEGTRHNVGFIVVGELAKKYSASGLKTRFQGETAEVDLDGEKALLLTPTTYMNLSGASVLAARDFYKITPGRPARRLRRPQPAVGETAGEGGGVGRGTERTGGHHSPPGHGRIRPAANWNWGPARRLELARFRPQQVYERRNPGHGAGSRPSRRGDRGLGPRRCSGLHESIQWIRSSRHRAPCLLHGRCAVHPEPAHGVCLLLSV